MSIELTTALLETNEFTSIEKHILTVLCFIANQKHEVHQTISQIQKATGICINTVESAMKKLREKKILIYTGEKKGYRNRIPVYRIVFNHPICRGDKSLITPSNGFNNPMRDPLITPRDGIPEDHKIKDNNKDNRKILSLSREILKKQTPTQFDLQEFKAGVKGYEWVSKWLNPEKT